MNAMSAVGHIVTGPQMDKTYKNTTAWFSCLEPNLVQALAASSSATPMALPSLAPLGPFAEEV